jgi:hypothetical protein
MNIIVEQGDKKHTVTLKRITEEILIKDIVPRIQNGTPGLQDKEVPQIVGSLIEELLKSHIRQKMEL